MAQIALSVKEGGLWHIYRMNLDGSGLTQLTFGPQDEVNPAWSPNGGQLLYEARLGNQWQVVRMNWDGSQPVPLTRAGNNRNAAWASDGKHIVFDSDRDGNRDIYMMDLDGANQVALTHNSANEYAPVWSPDESMIAYLSEQNATADDCTQNAFDECPREVFIMDAAGGFLKKVPDVKEWLFDVTWSPDGQRLAVLKQYVEGSGLALYAWPSLTALPDVPLRVAAAYPAGPGYYWIQSFSYSPSGNNGTFCFNEDHPGSAVRRINGCYVLGLQDDMLYTLVRDGKFPAGNPDHPGTYADAVWQP